MKNWTSLENLRLWRPAVGLVLVAVFGRAKFENSPFSILLHNFHHHTMISVTQCTLSYLASNRACYDETFQLMRHANHFLLREGIQRSADWRKFPNFLVMSKVIADNCYDAPRLWHYTEKLLRSSLVCTSSA